jgi:hypothetical protein
MALHVDVVKNEWLAGIQHPIAAVSVVKGDVRVDAEDSAHWRDTVLNLVPDVSPRRSTRGFLEALHLRLNGSYLFVTEPHDDRTCPYRTNPVQYIRSVDAGTPARRRQHA